MSSLDIVDPMVFRVIKKSIVKNILGPAQRDYFRTIGYSLPELGAEEVLNRKRVVSVYYEEGDFSRGSLTRPLHDMTFHLDMMVSADSKLDLAVLERDHPEEIQQQTYADALSEKQDAEARADELIDELFNFVYQKIMDKRNLQLGVERFDPPLKLGIANRRILKFEKGSPEPKGFLVMLGGQATLKCSANEKLVGAAALDKVIGGGAEFHIDVKVNEDEITKAGVLADTTKD